MSAIQNHTLLPCSRIYLCLHLGKSQGGGWNLSSNASFIDQAMPKNSSNTDFIHSVFPRFPTVSIITQGHHANKLFELFFNVNAILDFSLLDALGLASVTWLHWIQKQRLVTELRR